MGDWHLDVTKYKRFRSAQRSLTAPLIRQLRRGALSKGAKRLGVEHLGKTLAFESEDQMGLVMDHCLYEYREQLPGRTQNAVERLLARAPPRPGTDEAVVLAAMTKARLTLIEIERSLPDCGVEVLDVLAHEHRFIHDVALGSSGALGVRLVARLIAPDGIVMTTGGACTCSGDDSRTIVDALEHRFEVKTPEEFRAMNAWNRSRFDAFVLGLVSHDMLATPP